jgi:hypothetical protein
MKQTRLLEIIREEIAGALREGEAEENAAKNAQIKATDLEIKALQKKKAELTKSGVAEISLEEEQLDEMAKITEPIRKGIEVAVERMKKSKSDITPEEITKLIRNKKTQEKVAPELKAALDADEAEKGDDPKYTYGLGYPQAFGAVQIAMGLKKAKGSEPKAEKAPKAAAPKVKAAMAPKTEPMDDEDAEAMKSVGSDETAKELGKMSSRKDKVVKAYKQFEPQLKDKIAKAKEGDQEAMAWLKERTPIIKAYKKAKEVNI